MLRSLCFAVLRNSGVLHRYLPFPLYVRLIGYVKGVLSQGRINPFRGWSIYND